MANTGKGRRTLYPSQGAVQMGISQSITTEDLKLVVCILSSWCKHIVEFGEYHCYVNV